MHQAGESAFKRSQVVEMCGIRSIDARQKLTRDVTMDAIERFAVEDEQSKYTSSISTTTDEFAFQESDDQPVVNTVRTTRKRCAHKLQQDSVKLSFHRER